MNEERSPTQAYANMMTIIQSSGTGKSRLVDKLAEAVFTLPFNLRNPEEDECRFSQ
jgi:nicotinamide riboside kinase